jgi:SAM-dependent methyltransferase
MLDVITKADYWGWREAGCQSGNRGTLKDMQDTFILHALKDMKPSRLAEAGGGHSRVLPKFKSAGHECWNIDRLEGAGAGPIGAPKHSDFQLVRTFLGDFSAELPNGYFDVVFSISVVEHIPNDAYAKFVRDAVRILKPGGLFLHAIDVYLLDAGAKHRYCDALASRMTLYRQTDALSEGALVWLMDPVVGADLHASARYATNNMDELFQWNRIAPTLRDVREQANSCSLKLAMRKR